MTHATKAHSRQVYSRTTPVRTSRSLRSAAALGLGLLSLLSLSAGTVAHAGTVNWDNTPGDWFANPTHWDNGSYPGAGDDAVNKSTAAMTLGQSTTINSFFSNGAFTLQGGTFSGNQANAASTITVNNVFTVDGGQINNFTVNQGKGGSLVVTNNSGNSLASSVINSTIDMTTNAAAYLNINGVNTVNGQISLGTTSNGIRVQDGNANLILGNTGSLVGFGSVFQGGGNATLTNNGTVNATGGTLSIQTDNFNNTGTAEATNGGVLTLASNTTTTNSGALNALGAGSVVSITGSFTSTGSNLITAMNGGQVQVGAANLFGTINEASGTALVLDNSGKTFHSTTINGGLNLTDANAYANFDGVNTVNGQINSGTTTNGLHLQDGNTNLILSNTGSLVGFGSVFQGGGNATLTNNGTINANSASKTLAISNDLFTNTGTAEATNGGLLTLAGNTTTTNSGTLAATNGGVLDISGTLYSNAGNSLNGVGGTINVLGANLYGTINETSGSTLVLDNNGKTFHGTTVNGNLDMATNQSALVNFDGVNTINGQISLGTTKNGIQVQDGNANLILGSGGSLVGFGSVFQNGGNATLTNNGLVNANSAGNTLNVNTDNFNNTGTAEATKGGVLTLAANTTTNNSGLLSATNGGILDISGTFNSNTGNSINSVGGTVNVFGANLYGTINETSGSTLVLDNSGKNFHSTTVNGNLDMATNAAALVNFDGVNTVNGAITLGTTTNGIQVQDGNANLILNGSLTGFGTVFQNGGNATLTNNGTINANAAGKTLAIQTDNFNNTGTAEATKGGVLTLAANTTTNNSGLLSATNGGILDISGTFNSNAGNSINSVGGTVNVFGTSLNGTINETAGSTLVLDNSGKTFHSTTVNGNLDMATNAAALVNFDGVNTVNGAITLGTTTNGIQVQDGNANLILGNTGSLVGFGNVFQSGGNATLTNNGTVNATGGTLAIQTDNFNNTGTAEATNGGVLTLASNTTTTNTGTLAATSGGILDISGRLNSNAGNSINSVGGTVNVFGANLYGTINETSGSTLVLDNSGKNFHSTTVNGNLDLVTSPNAFVNFDGVNTINGQISLGTTKNGIQVQDGNANLILGSGGSLVGFGSVFQNGGNATLTNNGLVNANSAGNTLNVNTDNFTNAGTTQVQNGATLNVAGNTTTTDSGNILVKTGGTATFANPNLTQTAGLTQVDGTLNSPLTLTGGALSGTGTVNGNVVNSGGTVSAGNSASPFGTLALSSTFSQTSGALAVGFSNTQNSLLAVTGMVTTGGALNVNYLGSGPFTAGSTPFTFLDYGSLVSSISANGPTQYFSNETFDSSGNGLIADQNGFTYALINNTSIDGLQLEVVTNGAPTPPPPSVPEASTTVSMGLLLALGGGGLLIAKRRRTVSAAS